jgi:hypothetical protein
VVRPRTVNAPEASVITFGPGAFVGELDILSGQTVCVATTGLIAQSAVARRAPAADAVELGPDDNSGFVPGWPGCLPPNTSSETGCAPDAESLAAHVEAT